MSLPNFNLQQGLWLGNTGMVAKATKFLCLQDCLDLTDVSTKFQLDWSTKNRIIAVSLFSHFLESLFSNFSKCWEIQVWLPRQPRFYI